MDSDAVRPPLDAIINRIRDLHRVDQFCIKQQSRLDRSLESLIAVREFGFVPAKGQKITKEGLKAFEQAKARIAAALEAGPSDHLFPLASATQRAREPFDVERVATEKSMKYDAKMLPVWNAWCKSVTGLGELSLARIVGETGDLSNYATPSRVWKRMGLAVLDGNRQGNPGPKASAEQWIRHGYNPQRRSIMFVIAETLLRSQSVAAAKGAEAPYRKLYDDAKAKALAKEWNKMRAHRHGQRLVAKKLLLDLWCEWNGRGHMANDARCTVAPSEIILEESRA